MTSEVLKSHMHSLLYFAVMVQFCPFWSLTASSQDMLLLNGGKEP